MPKNTDYDWNQVIHTWLSSLIFSVDFMSKWLLIMKLCYCALNLITLMWNTWTFANVFVSAQHMVVSPICWLYQEVIKTALFLDIDLNFQLCFCFNGLPNVIQNSVIQMFLLYFKYRPCWMSFPLIVFPSFPAIWDWTKTHTLPQIRSKFSTVVFSTSDFIW